MKRKILASVLILIIALSAFVVIDVIVSLPTPGLPRSWQGIRDSGRPPSETPAETAETSTPPVTSTPSQLHIDDYPISVTPDHRVTITNNSQSTVEVYDFRLAYNTEFGTGFGTTCRTAQKLQPGQSASCQPVHSNVVSISSVSVNVRADGQQIVVTYSVQTPTPESSPIKKSDFLITIIPNRQVTITNNSKTTVQVLEFSMTYDFYSYIMYNAPGGGTTYGPIVRGVLTSEESVALKPGQSYPKSFNRQDMVAIISCRFSVKDVGTGQTLTVTYP